MYSIEQVAILANRAKMSSSYKPALLKALVRTAARTPGATISLAALGAEFVTLYWNQTIVFRLRQAASLSKEPAVIQEIRKTAERNCVRKLALLPASALLGLEGRMVRILKIDVLRRFHESKPPSMACLYTWREEAAHITLGQDALEFFLRNANALEAVANLWWARYLERVNVLAPLVIDKVRHDGARRSSLRRFLKLLQSSDEDRCFYCSRPFDERTRAVEVDHVIPWSFLLADPPWDLVLACRFCNASKSDSLPERAFLERLTARNAFLAKSAASSALSPFVSADDLFRLYDAAVSLEWPGGWMPPGLTRL